MKLKLKNILNESTPGYENRQHGDKLPTLEDVQKAYEAKQGKSLSEEYVESINSIEIANALGKIKTLWDAWKKGPLTGLSDIKPAQKELKAWMDNWFKQSIK